MRNNSMPEQKKEIPKAENTLSLPYLSLRFRLRLLADTCLPRHKVSALRGGIGEMLLRANCVGNRECGTCGFREECLVQRTMYSRFAIKPEFVTTGESVGYVYECSNMQESFQKGALLEFQLLLFGKTIAYAGQYIRAVQELGQQGLGKYKARFALEEVTDALGNRIYEKGKMQLERLEIKTVADYVEQRLAELGQQERKNKLEFDTPLTLKYKGEFLNYFQMEALIASVQRRIYMLNCFEGIETVPEQENFLVPAILRQSSSFQQIERYSSRKGEKMILRGIAGFVETEPMEEALTALLLAGELLHIGKNTSFGFGHYTLT